MKAIKDYKNKNILVLGLGTSGSNAAMLLHKLEANVTVNDKKVPTDLSLVNKLTQQGIKVVTGSHPLELLENCQLMVKNPGIPYSNPLVKKALAQQIPVITEPELAYEVSDAPLLGVTGTNGKTTTTTLISLMLKKFSRFQKVYSAGNIGTSVSMVAQEAKKNDVIVTELSSFQLNSITKFHPHIAVLTNIYEAHTDFHGTHEKYIQAKLNITKNQTPADYFIVNWDNEEARQASSVSKATIVPFSAAGTTQAGSYLHKGQLYYKNEKIISAAEIKIPGEHNVENALAAIAVAKLLGQSNEHIVEVLKTFSGVKHRTQYLTSFKNRLFYNDSKATNIEATEKALASFEKPVVLLAGGLDRGLSFEPLIEPLKKHVHALVVFGETAQQLAAVGKKAGIEQIAFAKDAAVAVPQAFKLSEPGDVILLSPACASWDQWPTFEVRGDKYIEAVEKLIKQMEV
ncbi:UDP-N-acetylmuramoyl-L-alanine--D-glutamate ligase [Ligilactobacillus acidipiscis]|uniref:UDP-N-acetylmuramoylalanine--D-glutamate ligase n=1 Tax=Ligilactobacillus acidipiscis TaxID=89059 RepID=A0A0R2K9L2_9LACO|nr:UDP-N-acetylmuramoyl-L-alanine--D-glutamate ligase [Ligilactobacillus acidipiscis]KRN86192.1 UDP-N-acetylmuramoyl-L-alanyl-D-glutamate synthetase [Ligilactobacillus acidipiscis]SFV40805.1 UDP-N-acetylmuramoylalanine--D-glutamate ligase [Ligilactobacillus acidipiscis]